MGLGLDWPGLVRMVLCGKVSLVWEIENNIDFHAPRSTSKLDERAVEDLQLVSGQDVQAMVEIRLQEVI